jgi:pseudouridine synthase
MRLNRYVAAASRLSRRGADVAIAAGRVTVNGQPGLVGSTVDDTAVITLDGKVLELPSELYYVVLHKPKGYVVSRTRQGATPTIYELLPEALQPANPVGRLDKDSSGILLLSNDGKFLNRAMHPSFEKEKIYEMTLNRPVTPHDLKRLVQGVELEDGTSRVRIVDSHGAEITVGLQEGRNRQLRRTAYAVGYRVKRLHRIQFGTMKLGNLLPGAYRVLREEPQL